MGSKMQKAKQSRKGAYASREKCSLAHLRYYQKTQGDSCERKAWTTEEQCMILTKMVNGKSVTDRQLSEILKRSMGAIQKERWKLKKFNNQDNPI